MKQALIIFVRHPELGKVKTRLAATLGDEATLSIYKKLLQHTMEVTRDVDADKFVFYVNEIVEDDLWQQPGFFKQEQIDADLGTKMQTAFEQVFAKGYEKVCIIGSDCFELSSAIIVEAFEQLNQKDVAIGPAKDGGYYLLGLKKVHQDIFQNKNWSTDTVFADTVQSINLIGLTYWELALLTDVDEEKDVPAEWLIDR